jgi:hypothetical protein
MKKMKDELKTEKWNGEIIDLWDKPDIPHNGSVRIENLFATRYKIQSDGSENIRRDEQKSPA